MLDRFPHSPNRPKRRAIPRLAAVGLLLLTVPAPVAFGQDSTHRARPELQAAIINLTVRGFEPSSVTLSPGKVSIVVRDRLFVGDLDLVFEKLDESGRAPAVKLDQRKAPDTKWQHHRAIGPGRYRVYDQRFPQWQCDIVVKAGQ